MARVPSVAQTEFTVRPLSVAVRKLAVAGRACSHCGSTDIRPSNRRNALDIFLSCLFLAPFRCRVCRERFHRVWRPSLMHPPDPPVAPVLIMASPRSVPKLDPVEPRHIEPVPEVAAQKPPEIFVLVPPPPLPAAIPAVVPPGPAAPGTVLIFESDFSIRKLLCRLLERRGYLTVEIAQTQDLATALRDLRADLLVMDVSLAGTNAAPTLAALAVDHPSLRILALSAEPLQDHEVPGRLLALRKPFPLDSFVDCVDRLLQRSGPPTTL
jgi:CheY-like chemotaxis protein